MTDRPKRDEAIRMLEEMAFHQTIGGRPTVDAVLAAMDEHLAPDLARKAGGLEVTQLADRVDTLYGRTGHHRTRIDCLESSKDNHEDRLTDVRARVDTLEGGVDLINRVTALADQVTALEKRVCPICNDTGHLEDAQAWDDGQRDSDCPYCPDVLKAGLGDLEVKVAAMGMLGERLTALERICIDPEIGLRGRVKLLSGARDRLDDATDRLSDEAEADRERLGQAIKRVEKLEQRTEVLEQDYGTNGYETEEDEPCGSLGNSGGVASGDITRSKTDCPCGTPTTTAATAGEPSTDSSTPEPQEERFGAGHTVRTILDNYTGVPFYEAIVDLCRAYQRDHAALVDVRRGCENWRIAWQHDTRELRDALSTERQQHEMSTAHAKGLQKRLDEKDTEINHLVFDRDTECQRREQAEVNLQISQDTANNFWKRLEEHVHCLKVAERERNALEARVTELEGALRPFASEDGPWRYRALPTCFDEARRVMGKEG